MNFRPGQWVKFDGQGRGEFQGALKAADGKIVGIYQPADHGVVLIPASITPVTPTGENLDMKQGGMVIPVRVGPQQPGLVPVTSRDDIPYARIKHLPSNWQPTP